jgi:hypothetical protein
VVLIGIAVEIIGQLCFQLCKTVGSLLGLSLVMSHVTYITVRMVNNKSKSIAELLRLTLCLHGPVTSDSAQHRVFLAYQAISSTFCVRFDLGSIVLRLALRMLLFPGLLPGGSTSQAADSLDDVALRGVVLARGLPTKQ